MIPNYPDRAKHLVSIVRYEEPLESVKQAVNLSSGLKHLPTRAKVFIKPNIVFWTRSTPFPKWGVITTSRVVEDMVELLKAAGASSITIGEGSETENILQHIFTGFPTKSSFFASKIETVFISLQSWL